QVQFVGGGDERGGSFEMISGSLHVCREFPHAPLALGLCTIGTVARMSASGFAYTPKSAVNVLSSAGIGAFRDLPIGATRIRLHAEGAGQFVTPRYFILNSDRETETEVHQPARATIRLAASWGMSF
ncbi:MAG: hypothetical protein GY811_01260, partial [Myxococcales bacterium]|nr:hypothetical protein [Myxococcales bacterium]